MRRNFLAWLSKALLAVIATFTFAFAVCAAPLKLVIHEEGSSEGEALPPTSRFSSLKRSLETALGRPVEITITRDRQRVYDWMERNQADVFLTNASDLAARALSALGYNFIATGKPDVTALFIGKGAAVENLKALSGQTLSLPRADTLFGQICNAELRDFLGRQYTVRPNNGYSAIVYDIENDLSSVGCIPSIAKTRETLAAKGIKILYEGRPQPALPAIASPGLPASDRSIIAKTLASYDSSAAGEAILKTLGVAGFTEGGEIRLRSLNAWLVKAK